MDTLTVRTLHAGAVTFMQYLFQVSRWSRQNDSTLGAFVKNQTDVALPIFLTQLFFLNCHNIGAMEDLVTRLRFRAAVDLGTMKAYARVGFRTERLSPISFTEGFTIVKRLPIVGKDGKTKLEVKANFALPEPEIEYSTENQRSMAGMGEH